MNPVMRLVMKIASLVGSVFIRLLYATLRVRHVRAENLQRIPQYIMVFWHAHLLLMLHSKFRKPITVMSSRSRDGQLIAGVFDWYGVKCVRGSSSRGGSAALRALIRDARDGRNVVFTPDGPTGPPRIAKDGVVWAARATGLPISPVAFAAKKKSSSDLGTAWWFPIHSAARCFSTASRSRWSVRETSRAIVRRSSGG